MNQSRTLLVVGAHAADFVWRAAGVIAVVTTHGGRANVVALSYGEHCGFVPTTFVDISAVFPLKQQAMEAIASQSYLHQYQAQITKYRANHARRISGRTGIQYAEAFQRVTPQVVDTL